MAQLTWQNVDVPSFGGIDTRSSGIFLEKGLTGIGDALAKFKENRDRTFNVGEINQALRLTDSASYEEALRSGQLQATPETADFFANRASQLLQNETSKIQQQGFRIDNEGKLISNANNQIIGEGYKIDNQGKVLDNQNKEVLIEGNKLINVGKDTENQAAKVKLDETLFDFNNKKEEFKAFPDAAAKAAEITNFASNGTLEGLTKARNALANPETIKLLTKAGYSQSEIDTLRGNIEAAATGSKGQGADYFVQANKDKELMYGQQGIDLATKHMKGTGGTFQSIRDSIQNDATASPEVINAALKHFDTVAPEIYKAQDPRTTIDKQAIVDQALQQTAPRETGAEQTLVGLLDRQEGAGDWDTLYGHSQREGGQFAGTKVSEKTIGELDAFSRDYGNWVAGRNNGTVATPMGRFQIVNSTLQQAAKEMGLSPDTKFDANTQTAVFRHLANQRLAGVRAEGPDAINQQMEALRKEWAGLRNVDDATLAKAITDFREGGPGPGDYTQSLTGPVNAPDQVAPGPAADSALNGYLTQLNSGKALDSAQNDIVYQQVAGLDQTASQGIQNMGIDELFAGETTGLMKVLNDPAKRDALVSDVVEELNSSLGDIDKGQLTDDLNTIAKQTNLPPGVIGAILKSSPAETAWILSPQGIGMKDSRNIDIDKAMELVNRFVDPTAKTPEAQIRGLTAKMNQQSTKATYAENIAAAQKEVRDASIEYFNAVNRKQTQANVDTAKPFKLLKLKEERLKKYMDAANKDPLLQANRNAALAPAQ